MPQPNEAIPSARVKMYVAAPGIDPVLVGLVEDAIFGNAYRSENLIGIGDPFPPDNVVNSMEGRNIRWTKVYQNAEQLRAIIAPLASRFTEFESFDVFLADPKDNKPLALAKGVLPEAFDFNARAGVSPRENYTGLCRVVLRGDEITQALAAA